MLTTYLLCFVVTAVAANPVFQRIPIQLTQTCPSQTCPAQTVLAQTCRSQTCPTQTGLSQTCPSQTCLPQTCPTQTCQGCPACSPAFPAQACSNQIRPTPCQTCQNNQLNPLTSMPLVVRQTTNGNCPCSQPVQNPMTNQPVNQDALNQLVLSKLLGPQLQMLLSPNAKACNQCEAPKPKADIVPNIINNYIIIPPDYFKTNETKPDRHGDIVNRSRGNKGNRRRKQNQPMARNYENVKPGESPGYVQNIAEINRIAGLNHDNNENRPNAQYSTNEEIESQRNNENDFLQVVNTGTNQFDDIINNCKNGPYPCEKLDVSKETTSPLSKLLTEPNKSQLLLDKIGKFLGNAVNLPHVNKNQNVLPEKISHLEETPIAASKQRHTNPERMRYVEEAIIKDFCKKHPIVPEEIAWSLLMNIKRQVQSQESANPNSYFPFGYGHYYSQLFNPNYPVGDSTQSARQPNDRRQRRPKPRRPGRKNKNREYVQGSKEPCDTCDKALELNTTVIDIKTETITTEKISTTTENKEQKLAPKKTSETQMETPNDFIDKLEQIKDKFVQLNEIETTTMKYNQLVEGFPELGKEDTVPTVYDNGVDYYPDFRGDNIAYYASDEELERYHYTADKIGVAGGKKEEQRYVKSKKHPINHQNSKVIENSKIHNPVSEYYLPIPTEESNESYEESILNESEEIQFRTPPSLEQPDFETKQINKHYSLEEIDEKFVADDNVKTSAYFDAKSDTRSQENDLKPVKVFSKDKMGKTSVETLFGHSKVVRYGHDSEEAGSSPVITYYLPEEAMTEERIQVPDGDSAVVVAKSIRNLEEIWK